MKRYILTLLFIPVFFLSRQMPAISEEILKWQECVEIAKKSNPELQSAAEKVKQAEASKGITRSTMLPTVDANAGITKTKTDAENAGPSGSKSSTTTYSYGITGKQLLFDGGKSYYDLKNSETKAESADLNYQVASATVRQNLRYAFVKLLAAQDQLDINKEIAALRKNNLELVRMRRNAGLEHLGSLLTAEANMAQAELEVAEAERNIVLCQRNLVKVMGLEGTSSIKVEGKLAVSDVYDKQPDFAELASSNPEVKEIIKQRIGAEYNLKASKLDYSPKVYGVLSANRSDTSWPPNNTTYSAGVEMSLNLFQGGKSYYDTKLSEAELNQLFADEKSTHSTVLYYLENAWMTLQNNIDTIKIKQKFLEAAEERRKIANAQYSIGTLAFDNWTLIQDALVNAKKNYIDAESGAMLSEADWIQAKGGTLGNEE